MKKINKVSIFLMAFIFGVCALFITPLQSIATEEQEPLIKYDLPYIDEATEMPILGYMGVPGSPIGPVAPSFLTRANLKTYMDAGFNILSGLYEKVPLHNSEVRKAIELCEEVELAYFVCDNAYRSSFDAPQTNVPSKDYFVELMNDDYYFESPAFAGIAVRDEPSIHCFDQMGKVTEALNEITDGKKMIYTNLFPVYANQQQLGFSNETKESSWEQYEDYVNQYLAKVKPTVLAYDCYTLTRPNSVVSDVNNIEGEVGSFIRSISMMRKKAKENNIPFWVTVASHDHVATHGSIPIKQTRWTVNTSLAFGAKGVQYYTYWNDGAGTSDMGFWADQSTARSQGLVSINGAPTDNYYRIQKINQQIKLIDEVLMQADHVGVMQFGKQYIELLPEDVLYSFGKLREVKGDAFVGCFTHNGNDVYYIVNNSVDSGIKTFIADFIENVNVRITGINYQNSDNPTGQILKNDVCAFGFNLAGGEGVLVEVLK